MQIDKTEYMSVDTETTGLNWFLGDRAFAIITGDEQGNTRYIEMGVDDYMPVSLDLKSEVYKKVFFNAKFDIIMLDPKIFPVYGEIHDVMIMAHVYNPTEPKKSLKVLSQKYLGIAPEEQEALKMYMLKHKIENYQHVPREIMEPYARKDAVITMKLFNFYREKGLLEDPVYKNEMRLMKSLIKMQQRGVLIDTAFCMEESRKCEERLAVIEKEVHDTYGAMNLNSAHDLADFLFNKANLPCVSYTEKGNPSMDKKQMAKYAHPIIPVVMEYRKLSKIKETYLDNFIKLSDTENAIHCDLFQTGAVTGRFSCHDPNLQNIPRNTLVDVRKAFICRPDYSNYYFDYSQIELRVLAHYSKEDKMISELTKEGGDLHAMTAAALFTEVTKQNREIAKRLNFGIIYGIGGKKFVTTLDELAPELNYSEADAKVFIAKYYNNYPLVQEFVTTVKSKIYSKGHVFDIYGRKYFVSPDEAYKAVNYLIQGCSAGILKNAMIKIHDYLLDKKSNLLLCIHDEVIVEVHKDEEFIVPVIKDLMEDYKTFRVPIKVNIKKTDTNWSEAVEINLTHQPA